MKKSLKWIITFVVLLALGTGVVVFLNSQTARDWISALGYEPSAAVATAESNLALTTEGETIFRATRPTIETEANFNAHCRSADSDATVETAVLGCYANNRIYVYNINNAELSGITESTLAHELLHAVWVRLSDDEKAALSTELRNFFTAHSSAYYEELAIYDEDQRLDELHSRAGTQSTDLSPVLKSHYAKYFTNQPKVVSYYTAYSSTFDALESELDRLKQEMDALNTQIETLSSEYAARSAAFSASVQEFNTCAATTNCFSSTSAFNSRRQELLAEQSALEALYNQIQSLVDAYNQKVAEYNKNALHTNSLESAINSNSSPTSI